jgi:hypothetical protein
MKWSLGLSLVSILCFPPLHCHSQNTLSFGARFGAGAQVIPAHAEFQSDNTKYPVQTNPSLMHGLMAQYLIGNKAGVETGVQVFYHSYSPKSDRVFVYNVLSSGPAMFVIDYQVPILLMYNFGHPYNVMRNFKIVAGTSVDWLSTYFLVHNGPVSSLHNFIAGFRIVTDKQTSRIEYCLEHQYSFKRFTLTGDNYFQTEDTIDARLSTLTLSIIWYFAVKELRHP